MLLVISDIGNGGRRPEAGCRPRAAHTRYIGPEAHSLQRNREICQSGGSEVPPPAAEEAPPQTSGGTRVSFRAAATMSAMTVSTTGSRTVFLATGDDGVRDRFSDPLHQAAVTAPSRRPRAPVLLDRLRNARDRIDLLLLDLRPGRRRRRRPLPPGAGVRGPASYRPLQRLCRERRRGARPGAARVAGYVNEHCDAQEVLPSLAPHLFPDSFNRRRSPRVVLAIPVSYRIDQTIATRGDPEHRRRGVRGADHEPAAPPRQGSHAVPAAGVGPRRRGPVPGSLERPPRGHGPAVRARGCGPTRPPSTTTSTGHHDRGERTGVCAVERRRLHAGAARSRRVGRGGGGSARRRSRAGEPGPHRPSHAPPPPCCRRNRGGSWGSGRAESWVPAAPAGRQDGGDPSNRGRAVTRRQRGCPWDRQEAGCERADRTLQYSPHPGLAGRLFSWALRLIHHHSARPALFAG